MKTTLLTTLAAFLVAATALADNAQLAKLKAQYDNALKKQAYTEEVELYKLVNKYQIALEKYHKTVAAQLAFSTDLDRLKAIEEENAAALKSLDGVEFPELKGKDTHLHHLRNTFIKERNDLFKKGEVTRLTYKKTLIKEINKLEKEFIANDDLDSAFEAKDLRDKVTAELGVKNVVLNYESSEYEKSATALSVGIDPAKFPDNQGWRWAHTKQTVLLEAGKEYIFTVKVIGEDISDSDNVPEFTPAGKVTWSDCEVEYAEFKKEWDKRSVKVRGGKFGWKQVTVKFKSNITKEVSLRLTTYKKTSVQYYKDFSLRSKDAPDVEMITLDLTDLENWREDSKLTIAKGVNKAGKE